MNKYLRPFSMSKGEGKPIFAFIGLAILYFALFDAVNWGRAFLLGAAVFWVIGFLSRP